MTGAGAIEWVRYVCRPPCRLHAVSEAIAFLREFQKDNRYPVVTRSEADGVITAINEADGRAAQLDPPFVMKD